MGSGRANGTISFIIFILEKNWSEICVSVDYASSTLLHLRLNVYVNSVEMNENADALIDSKEMSVPAPILPCSRTHAHMIMLTFFENISLRFCNRIHTQTQTDKREIKKKTFFSETLLNALFICRFCALFSAPPFVTWLTIKIPFQNVWVKYRLCNGGREHRIRQKKKRY